jgi:hypothetical protein
MTKEQQRIAIAEECGWGKDGEFIRNLIKRHDEQVERAYYQDRPLPKGGVPDYLNDLNAMHEVETQMDLPTFNKYSSVLIAQVIGWEAYDNEHIAIRATATQRAEAFLRTLEKWEETQ